MSNDFLKLELTHLLSEFDNNTLFSLTTTVTEGFLKNKITSREEAISAILWYSPDPINILKRKVITRELLLTYAHKRKLPLSLPASKSDIIDQICTFWNAAAAAVTINDGGSSNKEISTNTPNNLNEINVLAFQFTEWYFSMLNSAETIDPSHFYSNASFKLTIMTNDTNIQTNLIENDPQRIVEELLGTKHQYGLYFNPNLTREGVQGRIESHGLVLVFSCGTLHTANTCIGVFEQLFGLVRDPLVDNNWKIKYSELNLKNQNVQTLPTLTTN